MHPPEGACRITAPSRPRDAAPRVPRGTSTIPQAANNPKHLALHAHIMAHPRQTANAFRRLDANRTLSSAEEAPRKIRRTRRQPRFNGTTLLRARKDPIESRSLPSPLRSPSATGTSLRFWVTPSDPPFSKSELSPLPVTRARPSPAASTISTIAPSRLKNVEAAALFMSLVQDNMAIRNVSIGLRQLGLEIRVAR